MVGQEAAELVQASLDRIRDLRMLESDGLDAESENLVLMAMFAQDDPRLGVVHEAHSRIIFQTLEPGTPWNHMKLHRMVACAALFGRDFASIDLRALIDDVMAQRRAERAQRELDKSYASPPASPDKQEGFGTAVGDEDVGSETEFGFEEFHRAMSQFGFEVRAAEGYAAAEASGELDDDIRRFAALGYQSGILTATCRSGELSSGLGESWL